MKQYETFRDAVLNEPIVYRAIHGNKSFEDCIIDLCNDRQRLLARVVDLESIAPKKVRTKDGVMVWHCPDELIPEARP